LLALVIVSLLLMTIDRTTRLLDQMRASLLTILTPVTVLAESPYLLGRSASQTMATRDELIQRNAVLEKQNLELAHLAQQYRVLRAENDRLLALAGSRARLPAEVLAAEIVGIVPTANTQQVIVDKGSNDGVESGQAVIDAVGLFGQVVEVGRYTSRILLVADKDHAVPVEVNRNGVRSIASGSGRLDRLELEFVPVTTDIRQGDLLVTSGLGGRFPRGYPVGEVETVSIDANASFAVVTVRPAAQLDRSRHVLVVVGEVAPPVTDITPSATPEGTAQTPPVENTASPAGNGA
jgi:rod shape-determining protein MreC